MTPTEYAGQRLANGVEQFLCDGDRMPLKLLLSEFRQAASVEASPEPPMDELWDRFKMERLRDILIAAHAVDGLRASPNDARVAPTEETR